MENKNFELKMYCIVSREALKAMNGNRGKMMAQAGHAFLHAFLDNNKDWQHRNNIYLSDQRAYKITLAVDTTAELLELYEVYKGKCGTALIEDAGFTVFNEPTVTCLGIGPIYENEQCEKLKSLRPLI